MRGATFKSLAVIACAFACLAVLAAPAAAATTYSPNLFGDPSGPGLGNQCTPPASPVSCSLRGALAAAQAGDTIQLQAGTYTLSSAGELIVKNQVTIQGAGDAATTIEAGTGNQASRVIRVENGVSLTMSGVTITGGELIGKDGVDGTMGGAEGQPGEGVAGAGISTNGPLSLTDVVVTGNKALGGNGGDGGPGAANGGGAGGAGGFADGGGINVGTGLVTLNRVAITGNIAQGGAAGVGGAGGSNGTGGNGGNGGSAGGGGIDAGSGSAIVVVDSLIAGNVVAPGPAGTGGLGGILSGAGGAGGHGEPADGGGLFSNGTAKLTNVTFAGNVAGGGIGGTGGAARSATATPGGSGGLAFGGRGGAIALFNGAAGQFASLTIDGNEATSSVVGAGGLGSGGGASGVGGGPFKSEGGNVFVTNATLSMRGTIVAGGKAETGRENCSVGGGGSLTSLGHNLEDAHQCDLSTATGDLVDTPAGLGPLADNGGPTATMALLAGSAAIDAGEPACVDALGAPLGEDQRGDPRGTPCDIGAFEVQPAPPEPTGSGETGGGAAGGSGAGSGGDSGGSSSTPGTAKGTPSGEVAMSKLKLAPAPRDGRKSTIAFALSAADRVTFSLQRSLPGVSAGKRCVAARPGRHGKHCLRLVGAHGAPRPLSAKAGPDRLAWTPRGLAPGAYVLTASPAGGRPVTLRFTLHGPPHK